MAFINRNFLKSICCIKSFFSVERCGNTTGCPPVHGRDQLEVGMRRGSQQDVISILRQAIADRVGADRFELWFGSTTDFSVNVYNRPFSRRPDMLSTFALKFNLMKNVAQIRWNYLRLRKRLTRFRTPVPVPNPILVPAVPAVGCHLSICRPWKTLS